MKVDGATIVLNLLETHKGQVAAHEGGVSSVAQPGDYLGIPTGALLVIVKVQSVEFMEPREAHTRGVGTTESFDEPLRQMSTASIGYIQRENGALHFVAESWKLPALGAEAFPLSDAELHVALHALPANDRPLSLGWDARSGTAEVVVGINSLLSRHSAVLGGTGQGKTHFVAALAQQLFTLPRSRIIIFDVNGEYAPAVSGLGVRVKVTKLGSGYRIPYYALGRNGLARLVLPSDRAQMPAFRFAVEHLQYVVADKEGARLTDRDSNELFDDCRNSGADLALKALEDIRSNKAKKADQWPHMRALSCLAAEWYVLKRDRNNVPTRDAFLYGHVCSLVNRIRGLTEDPRFLDVVDVEGGEPCDAQLDWTCESRMMVEKFFGKKRSGKRGWRVHLVDLSSVTKDLMPFVLGSLLEAYASEIFKRGPGKTHPTLLILEEAHHYLRELPGEEEGVRQALAYERLAKEGRKFGLSLMVCTQRPGELSPTVLAQCGTWFVFRLTNEADQKAVSSGAEVADKLTLKEIPGLPRGQAVVMGNAVPFPQRVSVVRPDPEPKSDDPRFVKEWSEAG
ncbi:MAG TPA: ATP-binding protein [bacterium]|nr:ATP-binding protein [bacterium]